MCIPRYCLCMEASTPFSLQESRINQDTQKHTKKHKRIPEHVMRTYINIMTTLFMNLNN